MNKTLKDRTIASAFFALAVVAFVCHWAFLLLFGKPSSQTAAEHAIWIFIAIVSASSFAWLFIAMAALPLVLAFMAIWHWMQRNAERKVPTWVWVVNGCAAALSGYVLWPAAILTCVAVYYSYKSNNPLGASLKRSG
jgi:hypothetical protein